jgi:hypothetical protein
MMPSIDREERRKKRAPVIAFIVTAALLVSVLLPASWQWLPIAVGTSAAIAVGVTIDPPVGRGRRRGIRGRGSGLSAYGRDDADGLAAVTAHRWHTLVVASRLMPRQAGRRWLAEAESLLSEIPAFQRGAAIRSYLRSAPQLVVMMWAREVQRRARLGPRRPG